MFIKKGHSAVATHTHTTSGEGRKVFASLGSASDAATAFSDSEVALPSSSLSLSLAHNWDKYQISAKNKVKTGQFRALPDITHWLYRLLDGQKTSRF